MKQSLIPHFYKGVIYQIINIQNRKSYIGQTIQEIFNYIEKHFKNAIENKDIFRAKEGKYLYNAIRKYGKQNFKVIILGEVFGNTLKELEDNLNEAEIDCIYHFRTFGSDGEHFDRIYGYNMTPGGKGVLGFFGNRNGRFNKGYLTEGSKNGKYIKIEENKLIELFYMQFNCNQIGIILNTSNMVPKARLKKLNLKRKNKRNSQKDYLQRQNLINLFIKGELNYEQLIERRKQYFNSN